MRIACLFYYLIAGLLLSLAALNPTPTLAQGSPDSYLTQLRNPYLTREDLQVLVKPLSEAELGQVAEIWRGYLQSNLEQMAQTGLASNQGANSTQEQRGALLDAQRSLELKYRDALAEWREKGADAAALRPHELYLKSALKSTLRSFNPLELIRSLERWLFSPDGGIQVLYSLIGFCVAAWALFLWAGFSTRLAERALAKISTVSRILKKFLLKMVYWVTFVLGGLILLSFLGVNITPFFAIFGGVSFILGFALQQTIGNLASGLMMMILKPFDTGDTVRVAGVSGQVDEMSVVSAQIRTFDNQIVTIPNSIIWGDVITNVSASETRRVDLLFSISYSDSAAQAIQVLEDLVSKNEKCLQVPAPQIFVGELGESSVNIYCRPWVKREDYWEVFWGLTGAAKECFDAEGISIPFPQRDIHIKSEQAKRS
ncbi:MULTISPECIES: mechanosensitive ion channel family protein [Ruegeria]|uniref:Small-conductance mechanosensitive channel n=1 Tax=Ruegeria alba TaxID=2916756 RepID=A0ABS9P3X4_9RHOB|nr:MULTISPECIES: mechanosensitive ion channel family protein [Ruegeria]MCG6560642.1 mechanosensitive ion channel family protein [Ruegeria alba]